MDLRCANRFVLRACCHWGGSLNVDVQRCFETLCVCKRSIRCVSWLASFIRSFVSSVISREHIWLGGSIWVLTFCEEWKWLFMWRHHLFRMCTKVETKKPIHILQTNDFAVWLWDRPPALESVLQQPFTIVLRLFCIISGSALLFCVWALKMYSDSALSFTRKCCPPLSCSREVFTSECGITIVFPFNNTFKQRGVLSCLKKSFFMLSVLPTHLALDVLFEYTCSGYSNFYGAGNVFQFLRQGFIFVSKLHDIFAILLKHFKNGRAGTILCEMKNLKMALILKHLETLHAFSRTGAMLHRELFVYFAMHGILN